MFFFSRVSVFFFGRATERRKKKKTVCGSFFFWRCGEMFSVWRGARNRFFWRGDGSRQALAPAAVRNRVFCVVFVCFVFLCFVCLCVFLYFSSFCVCVCGEICVSGAPSGGPEPPLDPLPLDPADPSTCRSCFPFSSRNFVLSSLSRSLIVEPWNLRRKRGKRMKFWAPHPSGPPPFEAPTLRAPPFPTPFEALQDRKTVFLALGNRFFWSGNPFLFAGVRCQNRFFWRSMLGTRTRQGDGNQS